MNTYLFSKGLRLSDEVALNRYHYNLELSAIVYKGISVLEVLLRNAIVSAWQTHNADPDWPRSKSGIPATPAYNKTIEDIDEAIGRALRHTPTPTNDDVIAEITFGTWLHFFDSKFDTQNIALIEKILPYDPLRTSAKVKDTARYRKEIEAIWKLRNRISHLTVAKLAELISNLNPDCRILFNYFEYKAMRFKGW